MKMFKNSASAAVTHFSLKDIMQNYDLQNLLPLLLQYFF